MREGPRKKIKSALTYLLIFLILLYTLLPIVWIIEGSFKTHEQNSRVPPVWIFQPNFEAYDRISSRIFHFFSNSVIISVSSVLAAISISVFAAYSLSRFDVRRKRDIEVFILSTRMGPAFAFIVPFYLIMRDLKLLDTQIAVIFIYTAVNVSFAVWILKGFIDEVPVEIEDAALVDGCSRLKVLLYVTLPLVYPALIVTGTLGFITSWNEFLFAFILTREAAVTLPPAIASNVSFMNIDWEAMCAYATVSMLPVLTLALLVRKHLARGLTLGAIKG